MFLSQGGATDAETTATHVPLNPPWYHSLLRILRHGSPLSAAAAANTTANSTSNSNYLFIITCSINIVLQLLFTFTGIYALVLLVLHLSQPRVCNCLPTYLVYILAFTSTVVHSYIMYTLFHSGMRLLFLFWYYPFLRTPLHARLRQRLSQLTTQHYHQPPSDNLQALRQPSTADSTANDVLYAPQTVDTANTEGPAVRGAISTGGPTHLHRPIPEITSRSEALFRFQILQKYLNVQFDIPSHRMTDHELVVAIVKMIRFACETKFYSTNIFIFDQKYPNTPCIPIAMILDRNENSYSIRAAPNAVASSLDADAGAGADVDADASTSNVDGTLTACGNNNDVGVSHQTSPNSTVSPPSYHSSEVCVKQPSSLDPANSVATSNPHPPTSLLRPHPSSVHPILPVSTAYRDGLTSTCDVQPNVDEDAVPITPPTCLQGLNVSMHTPHHVSSPHFNPFTERFFHAASSTLSAASSSSSSLSSPALAAQDTVGNTDTRTTSNTTPGTANATGNITTATNTPLIATSIPSTAPFRLQQRIATYKWFYIHLLHIPDSDLGGLYGEISTVTHSTRPASMLTFYRLKRYKPLTTIRLGTACDRPQLNSANFKSQNQVDDRAQEDLCLICCLPLWPEEFQYFMQQWIEIPTKHSRKSYFFNRLLHRQHSSASLLLHCFTGNSRHPNSNTISQQVDQTLRLDPRSPRSRTPIYSRHEVVSICAASGHARMHAQCADDWLYHLSISQTHAKCPICRLSLPLVVDIVKYVRQVMSVIDLIRLPYHSVD
uniref:Large proline-rich protein bag6-A n=1 Tax=Lygus hesperus TaxID=30085 RepID=A0A0A9WSC1_LYGHE